MKKFLNITIAANIVLVLLLPIYIPSIAKAQESTGNNVNYVLLEPLPCIDGYSNCDTTSKTMTSVKLSEYVPYMFTLLIALSAVAAVVMIVVGGLQYITTDSWGNKKEGKERAKNAVLGLIMVLCTYLILRTVNPKLVQISSTIVPPIKVQSTPLTLKSYLDTLEAQASKYATASAEYKQSAEQARLTIQATNNSIDQAKKELYDMLYAQGLPENDPKVQAKYAQIEQSRTALKNSMVSLTSNSHAEVINSIGAKTSNFFNSDTNGLDFSWLQNSTGHATLDEATKSSNTSQAQIDQETLETVQKLKDLQAFDKINEVSDNAEVIKAQIKMSLVLIKFAEDRKNNPLDRTKNIDKVLKEAEERVTSTNAKNALKVSAESAKKSILDSYKTQ